MDNSYIPADGPEAALARVVRRLRLPYSRTFVARSVAAHPRPNSLLALVEVGADLGVKTRPAEIEASAFGEMILPLIVHFRGTEAGGFGVLERVTPDGFEVWDSSRGLRLIDREVFLEHWSGVVALVERAESRGIREKGYLRRRAADVIFSGWDPPAVVGSRAAPALRLVLSLLVLGLLLLAVTNAPAADRAPTAALSLLTTLGLIVAIVTAVSIGSQDGALSDRICKRGKFVDCHSVLASRYSRIFGIPLADIGIAFFGSLLLLMATGALVSSGSSIWRVVGIVYAASVPLSLILVGAQIAMRQLCTLCLAVHVLNFSGAAVTWLWLRPVQWSFQSAAASFLLLAVYSSLLLFFVVPYFKKHQGLVVLAGMHRRISGSPFASLAEILTEQPTGTRGSSCGVALEGPGTAEHELLVLVHPSCNKCDPVLEEVRALVGAGMVNAFVGLVPKDPEESDRSACRAVIAAGMALGPQRLFDAYAAAKKNLRAVVMDDPVSVLAAELSESKALIEGELVGAQRLVQQAEEFVDAHAEGTPAVFFDSRLYGGPLTHLAFLLQSHPELLATQLPHDPRRRVEEVSP